MDQNAQMDGRIQAADQAYDRESTAGSVSSSEQTPTTAAATNQQAEPNSTGENTPKPRRSLGRKCVGLCKWIVASPFLLLSLYCTIILVGLIPVNNDFQQAENGVTIHVFSTEIHSDIVMPIKTEVINWRKKFPAKYFEEPPEDATHVAIGWGAKKFFIETAEWEDFKLSTAVEAMVFPSATCMHVRLTTLDGMRMVGNHAQTITITRDQYKRLVDHIHSAFETDEDGQYMFIPNSAYDWEDAFFEAKGSYNCVNTCNAWAGRALTSAGIRTPWFATMPGTLCMYVPEKK